MNEIDNRLKHKYVKIFNENKICKKTIWIIENGTFEELINFIDEIFFSYPEYFCDMSLSDAEIEIRLILNIIWKEYNEH